MINDSLLIILPSAIITEYCDTRQIPSTEYRISVGR